MMINDDKWWQMISDIRLLYFKTGGTVNPTKICRGLTLFICWMNETRKPFVELKRSNWTIAKYSYFEICYDVLWYFMMYKRTYIYNIHCDVYCDSTICKVLGMVVVQERGFEEVSKHKFGCLDAQCISSLPIQMEKRTLHAISCNFQTARRLRCFPWFAYLPSLSQN